MGLGQVLKKHGEREVSYGSFYMHNEVMAILSTLQGGLCSQLHELSAGGMWHAVRGSSGMGGWMAPLHYACPLPIAIHMVHGRRHAVASQKFSSRWW